MDRKVSFSFNPMHEPSFEFYDKTLLEDARRGKKNVREFFRLLALCHTVMPEISKNGKACLVKPIKINQSKCFKHSGKLEYQAQSPDENALVSAARNFGFVFTERTPRSITITVDEVVICNTMNQKQGIY